MGVYEDLGVRRIINACGTWTWLGGTLMAPEVLEAMAEAAKSFVTLEDLQAKAGSFIAEVTSSEAAYVTCGASAAITLGTAACLTGLDPVKMNRLPDTDGMRNEVIIQKCQRSGFDRCLRAAGARLVEIGISDRCLGYELKHAINENTAAVFYTVEKHEDAGLSLTEVLEIAHEHEIPVLVDAATQLPPRSNLKKFSKMGADLVCFSGGKAIRGPQSTGILCGRKSLVTAAALNNQDTDIPWRWRTDLFDNTLIEGPPENGIGRALKVSKEEIIGLVTALKLFLAGDDGEELKGWDRLVEHLVEKLQVLPGTTVEKIPSILGPHKRIHPPSVQITLNVDAKVTINELADTLRQTDTPIYCREQFKKNTIVMNPYNLKWDDLEIITRRLREILA